MGNQAYKRYLKILIVSRSFSFMWSHLSRPLPTYIIMALPSLFSSPVSFSTLFVVNLWVQALLRTIKIVLEMMKVQQFCCAACVVTNSGHDCRKVTTRKSFRRRQCQFWLDNLVCFIYHVGHLRKYESNVHVSEFKITHMCSFYWSEMALFNKQIDSTSSLGLMVALWKCLGINKANMHFLGLTMESQNA